MAADFNDFSCPAPLADQETIVMGHGGGGQLSARLIETVFLPAFGATATATAGADTGGADTAETAPPARGGATPDEQLLECLGDGAVLAPLPGRLVLATDAHVVRPLEFPGGDIGELAVNGTVNDVAMMGGTPIALAVSFVLEEGLPIPLLRRIAESMGRAARRAGVRVVTGDTKVVDRGKCDGMFITTTGLGQVPDGVRVGPDRARPGDVVIVSGPIGRHGVAVLSVRENLAFGTGITSDTAPVAGAVGALLAAGVDAHALRDPTRGGLAATLNEIAAASGVGVEIADADVPVPAEVARACGFLGLDPMHVANEGVFVAFVNPADAERALRLIRAQPVGVGAAVIGVAVAEHPGKVIARTPIGAHRVVTMPLAEPLPRIC
ncbi:MAG: hydrogenase expression/formation protein HypE [Actinomycetia bacterium]|nr:hydrogenase expression/formation protein HypE [Actinomycetes bacterium]